MGKYIKLLIYILIVTLLIISCNVGDFSEIEQFSSNTGNLIISFSFTTPLVNGSISGNNIKVTVPFGTNVTALVPAINIKKGASISPPSGVPQDFTSPVIYTVTAEDSAIYNFTVTVIPLPNVITTLIAGNPSLTRDIAGTSATAEGNVTDEAGSPVTERGICWSTSPNPTKTGSHTASGSGPGVFNAVMTGLTENTLYYVRAYASNLDGVAYGNQVTINSGRKYDAIYQGGFVFYNDGSGGGLIASSTSEYVKEWITGGATQTTWNGNTHTEIGTGQTNTTFIINQTGHSGSAAEMCEVFDDGTYSDWYLPSLDELNLIWQKLFLNGIGGFGGTYWSSSENLASNAFSLNFTTGAQSISNKNILYSVRPVRSF